MEIINGYSSSMSLGTTVFDTITPETSTYNITSNTVYFFSGSYDTEVLYNTLTESALLSTYTSQYLGKISNVPLTFSYDDTKKERIIQNTTPNALRFKDPRYVNNSYIMGTSFTKPTIGAKYKFKMTNSTLNSGFLVNGSSVNVTAKKEYYNGTRYTYDIESDFFTTTGNITVTNPTALTYSGFEVVPYDTDGNIITNDIKWVAIKIKNDTSGDYFIYTDDIGTFYNPSFINLNSKTVKYGNENILHNVKIQYRDKSIGEILW